jgi:cobalt/nickel transport system permease protein
LDLHHVVLERWSRGASPIHRRDPRAKMAALLVFLVVLATARQALPVVALAQFLLLTTALLWARLPLVGALTRACIVLPFTLVFAAGAWLSGDAARGVSLLLKSYLSALAVLLVVSTTALPVLLRGLEMTGAPRFLLMVAQFLYRYLFVISEEAQHMSKAAQSRGASVRGMVGNGTRFRAAAGALAVLFARSYGRAGDIHRAMLARGFLGHFQPLFALRFQTRDAVFAVLASLAPVLLRLAVERAL